MSAEEIRARLATGPKSQASRRRILPAKRCARCFHFQKTALSPVAGHCRDRAEPVFFFSACDRFYSRAVALVRIGDPSNHAKNEAA